MSTWVNAIQLHWLDVDGRTCTQWLFDESRTAANLGTASALVAAAQDVSLARLTAVTMARVYKPGVYAPMPGPYASVRDKAQLILVCEDGSTIVHRIPAPKGAVFDSGGRLVDPEATQVIAYLAALAGCAANLAGSPVVTMEGGKRTRLTL